MNTNMKSQEIEKLIRRFEEGLTSIEEENFLKDFFTGDDVPYHLAHYKDLFHYYHDEGKIKTSAQFDQKLVKMIESQKKQSDMRKVIWSISALAASVIIIFGIFFSPTSKPEYTDTFNNPQTAYAETKKILLAVSGNFNAGLSEMEKLDDFTSGISHLENLNELNNGIDKLRKLSIINETKNKISNPK